MEWLLILAAIIIGVPAAAWLAQDSLIFFPQPLGSTAHLPSHAAPFVVSTADGTRVAGWISQGSSTPAPTVIYFGGNAEEVSHILAERRWPHEWSIVAINYRGYGTSEGKPGARELESDAVAIYDAVGKREGVDPGRIVVFGSSLGTAVATHVAAERPVRGVVLVSPYDSLSAVGRHHYPFLPVSLLLKHRFDAETTRAAAGCRCWRSSQAPIRSFRPRARGRSTTRGQVRKVGKWCRTATTTRSARRPSSGAQ
jgi:pimeloyl-ACP methyl ester carboxylesterase